MALQNPPLIDKLESHAWKEWFRLIPVHVNKIDTTNDLIVDLSTKGLVLKSTNGTYFRVTVNDAGTLVVSNLGTTKPG
jgi:hypothetical protein